MEDDRDLEIANAQAIIGLRKQEVRRLQDINEDPATDSAVRSRVQAALVNVLREIQRDEDELENL